MMWKIGSLLPGSLKRHQPKGIADEKLQSKLDWLTEYIFKGKEQFYAYQEVQSETNLDANLLKIYSDEGVSLEQSICIIRFYSFLLTNCTHQLVLCKLVSCPFMAYVAADNKAEREEQIAPYLTALIKAYVSKADAEMIKYMIVEDTLPMFARAVSAYIYYLQSSECGGVQATCLANCILLLLTKANGYSELLQIIYDTPVTVEGKTTAALPLLAISVLEVVVASLTNQKLFQTLQSNILFLLDILYATQSPFLKQLLLKEASSLIAVVFDCFKQLCRDIAQTKAIRNQVKCSICRFCFKLLVGYGQEKRATQVAQSQLSTLLSNVVQLMKCGIERNQYSQTAVLLCTNLQLAVQLLCSSLCKISHPQFNEHTASSTQCFQILVQMINMVVDCNSLLESLCARAIKLLLSAVQELNRSIKTSEVELYNVLQLFALCTAKIMLVDKQFLSLHYQSIMRDVSSSLMEPNQLFYPCQSHPLRLEDYNRVTITVYQIVRHFRLSLHRQNTLQKHYLRLEGYYHREIESEGWNYAPGQILNREPPKQMLWLNRISTYVVDDQICFILAVKEKKTLKVILNLRFKRIYDIQKENQFIRMKIQKGDDIVLQTKNNTVSIIQSFQQKRNHAMEIQTNVIFKILHIYQDDLNLLIKSIGQEQIVSSLTQQHLETNLSQQQIHSKYINQRQQVKKQNNKQVSQSLKQNNVQEMNSHQQIFILKQEVKVQLSYKQQQMQKGQSQKQKKQNDKKQVLQQLQIQRQQIKNEQKQVLQQMQQFQIQQQKNSNNQQQQQIYQSKQHTQKAVF